MEAGTITQTYDLKEYLIRLGITRQQEIGRNDNAFVAEKRKEALELFSRTGFPHAALERWRNTDLSRALGHEYTALPEAPSPNLDMDQIFKCNIPHFETLLVTQLNGWYADRLNLIQEFPGGMIIGSLAAAFTRFPELIQAHYGRYAGKSSEGLLALNTALSQDGIFIYVPDHTTVEQNVQMVNVTDFKENLFLNTRNLVILGENSHLRLVQCDDSVNHDVTFINSVTEVYLGKNSSLDHYKLQNKDDHTTLINSMYFYQEEGSNLSTNGISLNGGLIRNESHITLAGPHGSADVYGLYLMDRYQHVDNQVYIDHAAPDCQSRELFKGVLDDHASGVFNGHIRVHRDAQRTNAFQTNRNVLLTDKASIDTKPFLEIYADDVKCSHGATIGQLDSEALFYIRSRGISESNAKILLMYAFAAEVINKIAIPELRLRMDDMVKKRLRGELSQCEQCVLNCSTQEHQKVEFKIDLSRI
jgi:Fe-S cluster assembly protein SufD